MYKMMKVLAIVVLAVTIAGAGVVLYAVNTFTPVIEQTSVLVTPAAQAREIFDGALEQIGNGTFTGRVFAGTDAPDAQECTFLTYTVRLKNKGFFPAEWIALEITPKQDEGGAAYDAFQLDNNGANVLGAGSTGDLSATILCVGDAADTQRDFTVTCYVFGRQITFAGTAQ